MKFDMSLYSPQELTMRWQTAFTRGFTMTLPPVAVCGVINLVLRVLPDLSDAETLLTQLPFVLFVMFACVCVAAIVPLFGFAIVCKSGFKAIRRASDSKFQYQFFRCGEILPVSRYRIVTLTPFIFGGVIPFASSLFLGNFLLIVASSFLLLCLSPNAYIYGAFAKFPKGSYFEDSPTMLGGIIYTPITKEK